jgi:hypothetical protein
LVTMPRKDKMSKNLPRHRAYQAKLFKGKTSVAYQIQALAFSCARM